MSVIPCDQDSRLRAEIDRFAEALKTQAHELGDHGLTETDFYNSPILRGAIEKLRGEFSATMLSAFHCAFGGAEDEVHYVDFELAEQGDGLFRRTTVRRAGAQQHTSDMTAIRRV